MTGTALGSMIPALLVAAPLWASSPALAQDGPALAPEAPAGASSEVDLERAREEIEAARAEMARIRETLERDAAAREAELRELRAEIRRLERGARAEPVAGDRVAYGDAVRVEAGERVQEVVAFGDDVHVAGHVAGDATSFGGNVYVAEGGVVEGDAISFGGQVEVDGGGRVEGGRIAMGMPGVLPDAPVSDTPAAAGSVGALAGPGLLTTLYRRLILLLSFAGAGVLVVGLFPKRVGRIAHTLEDRPIRSAVVGLLASSFLALFSLLFAVITFGLGLPVSLVIVGMLGLAWLLGFVGLCQAVGDRLPFEQKPHGRWLAFLVGTILLTCIGSLPLVGWLVVGAASMVGIGAALSTRFGGR